MRLFLGIFLVFGPFIHVGNGFLFVHTFHDGIRDITAMFSTVGVPVVGDASDSCDNSSFHSNRSIEFCRNGPK